MLNQIVIMGRMVRDPELRHTQSGTAVTSFTLAVDRDSKNMEKHGGVCGQLLFQGPYGGGGRPVADSGLDGQGWEQAEERRGSGGESLLWGQQK